MVNEGKFGVSEAVCLSTIAISSKLLFSSPGFLSRFVGSAGWLTTIFSVLTAMAAFCIILILFYLYPGKNIVEIFEAVLGKLFGGLFSLFFSAYFLISAATLMREFSDIIKIYVQPDTPLFLLILGMIVVTLLSAMAGLESIARAAKLFGAVLLACFFLVLILSIPNFRTENLFPLLGYGFGSIVRTGLLRCSVYDEVMVLTVFAGSLQGTRFLKRAGLTSLLLSGFIVTLGLFAFSLAFPTEELQELSAPMFVLTRSINLGVFFQRLEPFFVFIWIISTLVTTACLFYSSASCYAKIFRITDIRPSLFPLSVFMFVVAMMPKNFLAVVSGSVQMLREYGWTVMFMLPAVTLLVCGIKKLAGGTL